VSEIGQQRASGAGKDLVGGIDEDKVLQLLVPGIDPIADICVEGQS
jgi:hypothetical protein